MDSKSMTNAAAKPPAKGKKHGAASRKSGLQSGGVDPTRWSRGKAGRRRGKKRRCMPCKAPGQCSHRVCRCQGQGATTPHSLPCTSTPILTARPASRGPGSARVCGGRAGARGGGQELVPALFAFGGCKEVGPTKYPSERATRSCSFSRCAAAQGGHPRAAGPLCHAHQDPTGL